MTAATSCSSKHEYNFYSTYLLYILCIILLNSKFFNNRYFLFHRVRGLETLLLSKNIKTIGDLCKLNIHELKALPFKSPKVICLHNALVAHLTHTQKSTLEKLKAVDDWCSNLSPIRASSSDSKTSKKDNPSEDEG